MNAENSLNKISSLLLCLTFSSSIECTIRSISFVAEVANQNALMASDNVHAITKNSYATMPNCMMTAIKYPIGLFQLKGNLQIVIMEKIG